MTPYNTKTHGFALLMALIVVSVVVTIGLTVLDLTLKQVRLSTNSKESEVAFHASNAALECARYWREAEQVNIESGNPITVSCFNQANAVVSAITTSASVGTAYQYTFSTTWGSPTRCSEVNMLVINADPAATSTVNALGSIIPGYPYGASKSCEPGGRCTVISARGYSKACSEIGQTGIVQREVLLEL